MKKILPLIQSNLVAATLFFAAVTGLNSASAQCGTHVGPDYSNSCSHDYFESISASGTGVSSTISVTGVTSCSGVYIADTSTQGITAPGGSTVNMAIMRESGYTAYLSVYVDWNNDHTFETSELCGTMVTIPTSSVTATYTFTVPTTGVVTGTPLHMRLMMSESNTGAPCTATYGQTYDFFFVVGSGCTTPVISFSPSSHDSVCAGGTGISITASGVGIGGTFTWSPSTGLSSSTGSTVTANPASTTVYTVTGITSTSCTATYFDTISVFSTTISDSIHLSGPAKFCVGDSLLLQGTAGTGYTYQWNEGGTPISHATYQSYEATSAGTFTLQIMDHGCTATSAAVMLTNYPVSTPVISMNGKILKTASYFTSYKWYENGTLISGATVDSIIATSNGSYTVKVTDTNGCTDTAIAVTFSRLVVANTFNSTDISIYPNPASNYVHIQSPVTLNAVITTIEGKVILQQANATDIEIGQIPAGIYFISLFDDTNHRMDTQRLIKY